MSPVSMQMASCGTPSGVAAESLGTSRIERMDIVYRKDEQYWVGDFPKAILSIVMKAWTES